MIFSAVPAFSLELLPPEKEYFIEAGDVLNINVFPAEEFSREVTVQPDGAIEIPLLGSIRAKGYRSEELQKILASRFSKYVSNPSITLTVRPFSSNKVAILGQVLGPGYYEYREGMRLLDIVAQAHGPQDYAKTDQVRIYRRIKNDPRRVSEEVIKADLAAVFNGKMDKNILLASGDIVYVPRKGYSTGAKWISDNFAPWLTLFTFVITATLVMQKN